MNLLQTDPEILLSSIQYCSKHDVDYLLINDCAFCKRDYCPHCKSKPTEAHFGNQILSCYGMYISAWGPDNLQQVKYILIRALQNYKMPLYNEEESKRFAASLSKEKFWEWCLKMACLFMLDDDREKFLHSELIMTRRN